MELNETDQLTSHAVKPNWQNIYIKLTMTVSNPEVLALPIKLEALQV